MKVLLGVAVFVAPLIFLAGAWLLFHRWPDVYWWFAAHETQSPNHQLETLQFAILLAAAAVGLVTARSLAGFPGLGRTRLVIWLFVAGCTFVALEEVAFGQQFFGFATPEAWRRLNFQKQTTLHNLRVIQDSGILHLSFIAVGLVGGLGWMPKHYVGRFWTMSYLLVDWPLASWFLPAAAYYSYVQVLDPDAWIHQEVFEFILFGGLLLVGIANLRRARRHRERMQATHRFH